MRVHSNFVRCYCLDRFVIDACPGAPFEMMIDNQICSALLITRKKKRKARTFNVALDKFSKLTKEGSPSSTGAEVSPIDDCATSVVSLYDDVHVYFRFLF